MLRKIVLINLSLLILVLGALGCGSESTPTAVPLTAAPKVVQPTSTKAVAQISTQAPTSAPTKAPATANPTQVPPTSAPATQAAAQPTATSSASASASFDGEWEGKTSENSPVYFTVRDNEISYANVNFSIGSGGCQGLAGNSAWSVQDAPIQDDTFTVLEQNKDSKIELEGTFQSPTQASGTAHIEGNSIFCGDYEMDVTWTANPESVVQATAEAKPTDPPAASTGTGAACAIFLQAELEEYLGKKVKFTSDEASGWQVGSGKVSGCQYDVVDSVTEGSQLILGEMSSPAQAKTDFEQGLLQDAKDMGVVPEAVSGVGDEAYWVPGLEIFTARSGKYVMLLVIAGQTESNAKLQTFVSKMLERLPE